MSMSYSMTRPRAIATLDTFKRRIDNAVTMLGDAIEHAVEDAPISHKRVGGLHFVRIGRFSGSFSVKRAAPKPAHEPANVVTEADRDAMNARIAKFVR